MRITHLTVQNYKSLRAIEIVPGSLNIIVGANASGKSNFADCLDFISEVYRHGLEVAVARKGGYENIAHRRQRRSKGAISIAVDLEISSADLRDYGYYWPGARRADAPAMRVRHKFSFAARGSSIRAEFKVTDEELSFSLHRDGAWEHVATVTRDGDGVLRLDLPRELRVEASTSEAAATLRRRFEDFSDLQYLFQRKLAAPPTVLASTTLGGYTAGLLAFTQAAGRIRVFQISPNKSREFGVPTPRPELAGSGENLPAVVDKLQKSSPEEWKAVMQAMRTILPGLRSINVDYTANRTLGLFFEEEGVGRPWSVGEVSDGTIQTLALLVAIFDPQASALMLEEPENSVHPWIIRHVLDACRDASQRKQILITTHSPIVMNAVRPEEIWVMWRSEGASQVAPFTQLDPDFPALWSGGEIPTFEYLDSGAVPRALPPGPVAVGE